MSNAFAIGAVSAVLKNLLDNAVVDEPLASSVGTVRVSALAPDQVKTDNMNPTRLNLFLYHVEPNAAWRNRDLPSRDFHGRRIANQPLALDLYYLLSAYGTEDFQAEILLGYAAQLLHEVPVLTRDAIRRTFETPPGPPLTPPLSQLATSELTEQIEQIRITPHAMNSEESFKLWSAIQTHYRPSIAYQVSVVLIEAARPARSPLPVLRPHIEVEPSLGQPYPTLTAVVPPNQQPSIRLGQTLTLLGQNFGGTVAVRFETTRRAPPHVLPAASVEAGRVTVVIPNVPADWPAGNYLVNLTVTPPGQAPRTTNALPLALAPELALRPDGSVDGTASPAGPGPLTITLNVRPVIQPAQSVWLVVGEREAAAQPRTAATSTVTFIFDPPNRPPPGTYFLRLRVDLVESLLVRRDVRPPAFDPSQVMTIP